MTEKEILEYKLQILRIAKELCYTKTSYPYDYIIGNLEIKSTPSIEELKQYYKELLSLIDLK